MLAEYGHRLCQFPVLRLAADRRAAAAFEFALILPVFLLMMCGTFQYGVLFYTWNVALNGARNAARALALGQVDEAGAEAMMRNALPPWVTASRSSTPGDGGDRDCGGGNGDPNDTGGYGPGGCGAGNGGGGGSGGGSGGGEVASGDGITAEATDDVVGGTVTTRLRFPSERATVLPLAPMPDELDVEVHMVKEA